MLGYELGKSKNRNKPVLQEKRDRKSHHLLHTLQNQQRVIEI